MSSHKTPNYNLHKWEPEDSFLRSEFNDNFTALDTAVKGAKSAGDNALTTARSELNAAKAALAAVDATKCEVYAGSYSGNGQTSRDFALGFRPKAVLVETNHGLRYSDGSVVSGLAVGDCALTVERSGATALSINNNGFTVYYNQTGQAFTNHKSYSFVYFALK